MLEELKRVLAPKERVANLRVRPADAIALGLSHVPSIIPVVA